MSILGTLAKLGVELGADLLREWLQGRKRAAEPAGTQLPRADAERIAAISRAAGLCPRCATVHPSDKQCPGAAPQPQCAPWQPRETLRPPKP